MRRDRYGAPGRRTERSRDAIADRRSQRPRILIVCEGEKTEPNYFRAFRVSNDIHGCGMATLSLVAEAERLASKEGPFDQVWCVFDRDAFEPDDFDNAIHQARQKGYRVAVSNESFELWYVLHFEFVQSALTRQHYCEKLSQILRTPYRKNDGSMFLVLEEKGNVEDAIQHAKALCALYAGDVPYHDRNPMTTVHELVQELRKVRQMRNAQ